VNDETTGELPCESPHSGLYDPPRGWRGQAPRQPGQVRKEAAVTSPAWVVVQPLTKPPLKVLMCKNPLELNGLVPFSVPERVPE
jgi:hypothetical protein